MKKNFKTIVSAIAVLAMASCSKEAATQNGGSVIENPVEYTLAVNAGTKASLEDGKKVQWCSGDKIAVFAQDGTKFELTVVESTIEGGQASFSGQITEGAEIVAAVSPASAATSFAEGTATITIPASQTIPDGAVIDPAALVMSGEVSGASAELHNAVALLKFTPAAAATKFHFGGVGAEKIVGAATATVGEEAVATGAAEVVVSGNFAANKAYYAAIAPISFTKGVAVAFEGGAVLAKSTDKSITIARNDVADLGTVSALSPISDAAGLFTLARCVNALSVTSWNEELGSNIDLGGATWTPIGNGTYQNATTVNGSTFQGAFDGKNFKVDNFQVKGTKNNGCNGLFGIVKGSVMNLTVGKNAKYATTNASASHTGGVVAYLMEGVVDNCKSSANINITGGADAKRSVAGGVVGLAIAQAADVTISNCEYLSDGVLTSTNTVNKNNGGTGFQLGGVLGMGDTNGVNGKFAVVTNCVNRADIDCQATRVAGIVATSNKYVKITGCTNYGSISSSESMPDSYRPAGITSAGGAKVYVKNCVNYGDIYAKCNSIKGYCGGIMGQPNNVDGWIDGCTNYGTIYTNVLGNPASDRGVGSIVGRPNVNDYVVKNCGVGGAVAMADGSNKVVVTAENFAQYICCGSGGKYDALKKTDNYFASRPTE